MDWQQLLNHGRLGREDTEQFDEGRSPFQKDFDRIIFSSAFRRMQDKTQVFPLAESDYVRTRLTHSLEVSCVGRSLGTQVGASVCKRVNFEHGIGPSDFGTIVGTACLAHDLGNPPFGHSGERAIQHWFTRSRAAKRTRDSLSTAERKNVVRYDGNPQGFRLLSRLLTPDNPGLQLTYASLGAFVKYPLEASVPTKIRTEYRGASAKKFGFFETEKDYFLKVATELGLMSRSTDYIWYCRHPLAFLMEAADDICYRIIDFEDGCRVGLITQQLVEELLNSIIRDTGMERKASKMENPIARLQFLRARTISSLVREAARAFLENEARILDGSFDNELIAIMPSSTQLGQISNITKEIVYPHHTVVEVEAAGFEVIGGLLEAFFTAVNDVATKENPSHKSKKLSELVTPECRAATTSVLMRLLNVIDFVCGMTDTHALTLFRRIKGISLSTTR